MTRTIRTLFAKALVGGACVVPFVLPAAAVADDRRPQFSESVPEAKKKTAKELHQLLLKSSGWVRFEVSPGVTSNGTAWVIDADRRLMVTNDHVVNGADEVRVLFPKHKDGKLVREEVAYQTEHGVRAVVIDRDRTRDLAMIQLDSLPAGAVALKLADDEPEEGDVVRTIGGFTNGGDGLVWGGVGGEVRSVGANGGLNRIGKVRTILSTAPTNGGNSGGPLVSEAGEVIGVNSYGVETGLGGRKVNGVAGHISVREVKDYLAVVNPLVAPSNAAAFTARGERKRSAGRTDAAIKDFSAAIEKDDKYAHALYLRGKSFTEKNDARTGLEDLNAAVKLAGTRYEYRVARGVAYRAIGKADEATSDFSAAIRTDPSRAEGYNERGVTQFNAKKFDAAEADFTRAIENGDADPLYWSNRAEVRMAQKKFDAAAADWQRAAKLAPWDPSLLVGLANCLMGAGKPTAAAEVFLDAANKTGNPAFLTKAGLALTAAGDFKQAVKLYADAIRGFGDRGSPTDVAVAYMGRGVCHRELKQFKDAIDDLSKAIDLTGGKNGHAYLERGLAHRAHGSANAAADDFAAAEKLGVKVDAAVKGEAKPEGKGKTKANASPVVGTWKTKFAANGMTVTGVATLKTNGEFEGAWTISGYGETMKTGGSGTWSLKGDKLVIRTENGTVSRPIDLDGDTMDMELAEFGTSCTWTRVK
jgi:tetratricopeptide (TPR) repeat protein